MDGVLGYVNRDRQRGLLRLTNISEKLMGDKFSKHVFDSTRELIMDPSAKHMKYVYNILDNIDPHVVKMHVLNLGYQSAFYGFSKTMDLQSPESVESLCAKCMPYAESWTQTAEELAEKYSQKK